MRERVQHLFQQSLQLTLILGVVAGALGVASSRPLLRMLGADAAVEDAAFGYLAPLMGATVFAYLNILLGAVLRGVGNTRLALLVAVVVNGLAANLWPHLDLTNIHQPVAEVLLPLWDHDREPYDLVRMAIGRSGLRLVVGGSVVGLWAMLAACAEGGYRMAAGIIGGALTGLLLVQATREMEPHPLGERNLAYIERIWEPTAAGPGRSALLAVGSRTEAGGDSTAGESSRGGSRPRGRRRGRDPRDE